MEQERLVRRVLGPRPAKETSRWLFSFLTAGLLPPRLREAWDLPWGPGAETAHRVTLRALGRVYRALPPDVRFHAAWHEAMERVGAPGVTPPRLPPAE